MTSRRQQNQTRLVEEGVQLLLAKGYHGTGVQEIVNTVGVPKGSFYQYFSSKESFCAEVISHYIQPFVQRLREQFKEHPDDPRLAFQTYFSELAVEAAANDYQGGCLLGNLLGEIGELDGVCHIALNAAVTDYKGAFEAGIEQAQSLGQFQQDVQASELAEILFCAWQGALLQMKVERSAAPLERTVHLLINNFFLS